MTTKIGDFAYPDYTARNGNLTDFCPKLEKKDFNLAVKDIKQYYSLHQNLDIREILYVNHNILGFVFLVQTKMKPSWNGLSIKACPHHLWKVHQRRASYSTTVDGDFYKFLNVVERIK